MASPALVTNGFTDEMLGLDDEKLADFFVEGHAGDGFLDEGVLVRSERFFWLLCALRKDFSAAHSARD